MPDRDGSGPPNPTVTRQGLSMPERVPEHDDVSGLRPYFSFTRPLFGPNEPDTPRRYDYGDLIEGVAAAAALLVIVVIGVSPWLAIPLSVVTYIAVALLRSARDRVDETVSLDTAEHPVVEAITMDHGDMYVPVEVVIVADTAAECFRLTRREREILPLLAQRLTDREIAELLCISHRTAMNHTANILGKLGLESRRDVAAFGVQHDLLQSSTPSDDTK